MVLLSGFIGALLGVSITLLFNVWKFHRDERTARCDELCNALITYAMQASDYWATEFNGDPKQRVIEARILGGQALIDGLYADLREVMKDDDGVQTDEALSGVFDLLSGGDFSVEGRSIDQNRLTQLPQVASAAILAIRRSHRKTFPLGSLFSAFHENRHRKLDMRDPCA